LSIGNGKIIKNCSNLHLYNKFWPLHIFFNSKVRRNMGKLPEIFGQMVVVGIAKGNGYGKPVQLGI
jgi:hypothetical protein